MGHWWAGFPAIEALEAANIDLASIQSVAPGVDLERLLIREASSLLEKLVLRSNAAIALPRVVYMHRRWYRRPRAEVARLVVHEVIHVSQWRQTGTAKFAVIYAFDYVRGRFQRRGHEDAYHGIRYEIEARAATDKVLPR